MVLEQITKILSESPFEKAFYASPEQIIFFLLGSLVVGYISLTYTFVTNEEYASQWANIPHIERAVFGLGTGIPAVLVVLFGVAAMDLAVGISDNAKVMVNQLYLILPFGYIYAMFRSIKKEEKKVSSFLTAYSWVATLSLIIGGMIILSILVFKIMGLLMSCLVLLALALFLYVEMR